MFANLPGLNALAGAIESEIQAAHAEIRNVSHTLRTPSGNRGWGPVANYEYSPRKDDECDDHIRRKSQF